MFVSSFSLGDPPNGVPRKFSKDVTLAVLRSLNLQLFVRSHELPGRSALDPVDPVVWCREGGNIWDFHGRMAGRMAGRIQMAGQMAVIITESIIDDFSGKNPRGFHRI